MLLKSGFNHFNQFQRILIIGTIYIKKMFSKVYVVRSQLKRLISIVQTKKEIVGCSKRLEIFTRR